MKRIIISILPAVCIAVLFLSGCGPSEHEDVQSAVIEFLNSEQSQTFGMISATADSAKKEALQQYLNSITIQIEQAESEFNCTVEFPSLQSIQENLVNSDSFMSEYKTAVNKEECIYGYVVNFLLSGAGIKKEKDSFSVSASGSTGDFSVLKQEVDDYYQRLVSAFALMKFYDNDIKNSKNSFVESSTLDDFIVKVGKNKILVSKIKIYDGSNAIKELESLSPNNALIKPGTQDSVYVIKYSVTNLSRKKVTFENYFRLGDTTHHLYENSGFHIEGLTGITELIQGKTVEMVTALVGNSGCDLYYYDSSMTGAVHWDGVPVQK